MGTGVSELESHALGLGKVLGNFQSLELSLRVYLYTLAGADPEIPYGSTALGLSIGSTCRVTPLTDYDSLGALIARYNAKAPVSFAIDPTLVRVRDAIAHGRPFAAAPERPVRLVRFSQASAGSVSVIESVELTDAWFAQQIDRIVAAIRAVGQATSALRHLDSSKKSARA